LKQINADIVVIGGGPAGLAAALKAKALGAGLVMLIDRDLELGGILQQCIHDGFGLHRFGKRLSGNQYAQAFIDELAQTEIEVKLDTMVLEVTPERIIYACNKKDGMIEIEAGAVILAMGCRERTANQVFVYGDRPTGVLTAGAVQRYINMEGYLPGSNAVILGSGDIGLIMARRMTLEGIKVSAVYEAMSNPGGLMRNVVQCLDDFDIPLHLSTTVTKVHGKNRVEAVTIMQVDQQLKPVAGTEKTVACDLLVLAVGLIPENELSLAAGVEIDPRTRGPLLDNTFMTSVPGIFACGNVAVVFDLVDYVSLSGEIAAQGAVEFITGRQALPERYHPVKVQGNINFVVPQRLRPDCGQATFFMRVRQPDRTAMLRCSSGDSELLLKRCRYLTPPEMLSFTVEQCGGPLSIELAGEVEQ
jgi:NADPH-dependent 2,4-dienoyl-CoA reductase/sulfur reductase-like enzyme